MNGYELAAIVEQRHATVETLLKLAEAQLDAITAGRMNELMQLLAQKQQPLSQLGMLSKQLQATIGEDAESRVWTSQQARLQCRKQHEETEQLILQLMQLESECEALLVESRARIESEIGRSDGIMRATQSYTQASRPVSSGSQLDLSNG